MDVYRKRMDLTAVMNGSNLGRSILGASRAISRWQKKKGDEEAQEDAKLLSNYVKLVKMTWDVLSPEVECV